MEVLDMGFDERDWWKKAVVYEVYPKSFQDSNNDGIGDIRGIIQRLDYLETLGIDAIWLCPIYRSPQDDNGYDISDYYDIDPMFGTLSDMEELIKEAGTRRIGIVLDMVLNHSSDEHMWFKEAKKSRTNPFHDFYVWRDGIEGTPPNDMKAAFGGSAWEWVPEVKQYYFHQFSVKQPDLNWNCPALRKELYKMLNWWIAKGVKGFRFDVIDQIAKEPDQGITANGPKLHEYIREMNRETFGDAGLITVGEAWGATPDIAKKFSDPDGSELSMVFQFEHSFLDQQEGKEKWDLKPLDPSELKRVFSKWQREMHGCGWNSLFWDNHDLPRIVSRWGNDSPEYRERSAKMLATLLFGLQGTPYIYQGEELAMTNVRYPLSDYRDIELIHMAEERRAEGFDEEDIMRSIYAKGRDNARTPMQWSAEKNAGFSSAEPWIKVNPNYEQINAESQVSDPDSVFSYYRRLIQLRKKYRVFIDGDYRLYDTPEKDLFAYYRQDDASMLLVMCNFSSDRIKTPLAGQDDMDLLLANYQDVDENSYLRPYEARIYYCSQL